MVIVNNRSNAGGYGTFGSATVTVAAKEFIASNLTFANDYGTGSQAVAINMNGDKGVYRNVRFLGNQDTLLANTQRQYIVNSYVEGTVDFIFGDATAVFNATSIYEKRSTGGPLTAARTPAGNTYGFLIYKCTITGATTGTTQLGRPWGPAAQVLFRESSLSATIATAQPWIDMSGNAWPNARFSEYKNTGSGASVEQQPSADERLDRGQLHAAEIPGRLGRLEPDRLTHPIVLRTEARTVADSGHPDLGQSMPSTMRKSRSTASERTASASW